MLLKAEGTVVPKRIRSRKISVDHRAVTEIPKGETFVMLSRELLASEAWQSRSINCRRLVNYLMIEHLSHGGYENGHLTATFDDLVAFGITRRLIHRTFDEIERLGLAEVERGGRRGFCENYLNKFRLTFLKDKVVNEWGHTYTRSPTNEWKRRKKQKAR